MSQNKTTAPYRENYKNIALFFFLTSIFFSSVVSGKNISQLSQLKAKIKEQSNTIELLKLKLQQCHGGSLPTTFDDSISHSQQYQRPSSLIKSHQELKASQIDPSNTQENSSPKRNYPDDDLISFP